MAETSLNESNQLNTFNPSDYNVVSKESPKVKEFNPSEYEVLGAGASESNQEFNPSEYETFTKLPLPEQFKKSWLPSEEDPESVYVDENEYSFLKGVSEPKKGKSRLLEGETRAAGGFTPTVYKGIEEITKESKKYPGLKQLKVSELTNLGLTEDQLADKMSKMVSKMYGDGSKEAENEVRNLYEKYKGSGKQALSGLTLGIVDRLRVNKEMEALAGSKHFPVKDYLSGDPEGKKKIQTWISETSRARPGEFNQKVKLFNDAIEIEVESGDTVDSVNKKIMNEVMHKPLNQVYELAVNPAVQMAGGLIPSAVIGAPFRLIKPVTTLGKAAVLGAEEVTQAGAQAAGQDEYIPGFIYGLGTSAVMMGARHGIEQIGKNLGKLRPKKDLVLPKTMEIPTEPKPTGAVKPAVDLKETVVPPKAEEIGRVLDITPEAEQAYREANKGVSIEGARNKDVLNLIGGKQVENFIEANPTANKTAVEAGMLKRIAKAVEYSTSNNDSTGENLLINNTKEFQDYLKSDKQTEILGHNFESSAERAEPLEQYGRRAIRNFLEPVALEKSDILSEASSVFKGNKYLEDLAKKEKSTFDKAFDLTELSQGYKKQVNELEELSKTLNPLLDEGQVYFEKDSLLNKLNKMNLDEVTIESTLLSADRYNELTSSTRRIVSEVAHNAQWFREIEQVATKYEDVSESSKLATNLISSKNKAKTIFPYIKDVPEESVNYLTEELLPSIANRTSVDIDNFNNFLESSMTVDNARALSTLNKSILKYNSDVGRYTSILDLVEKAKQGNLVALQRAAILRDGLITPELKIDSINAIRSIKDDWVENLPKSWDDAKKQEVFDHIVKDTYTRAIETLENPKKALLDVKDIQTELKIYKYFGEDYLKDYQTGIEDILGKKIDTNYLVANLINPTNNYDKSGIIKKDILRLSKKLKETTKGISTWERIKDSIMLSPQRERKITRESFTGVDIPAFANQHDDIRLGRQEFEVFANKNIKPAIEKYMKYMTNDDFNSLEKLIAGTDITNREFISTVSQGGSYELTWFGNTLKEVLESRSGKHTTLNDIKSMLSDVALDESTTDKFLNVEDLSQYIYNGFFVKDVGLNREIVRAAFDLDKLTKELNWKGWKLQSKIIEKQNIKYGRNYSPVLWREDYVTAKKIADDVVYNDFREVGLLGTRNEFFKTLGSSTKGQLSKLSDIPLQKSMNFVERVFNQAKNQLVGGYSMHSNIELDSYARLTSDMGYDAQSKFILDLLSPPIIGKAARVRYFLRDLDEKLTDSKYIGNPYLFLKNFGNLIFNPISAILLRPIGLTSDVITSGIQTMASQGFVTGAKQLAKQTPNIVTSYVAPFIALTKILSKNTIPEITGRNARETAVNTVLLGTRDIQNTASLFKVLEVSRRKNQVYSWLDTWENKQDAVFAFLNNNIKEYSEQRITKTVLNSGYKVLEKLDLILRNQGLESGREYLTKELRLLGTTDIDRLLKDVQKRGVDAYQSFLPAYRDATLGRFGRGALSPAMKELGQIFPGATQFVSAMAMLPMNVLEAGGQAKDKLWAAISNKKDWAQLEDSARWSLVSMGSALLFAEGMAYLATNGLPESFVDMIYNKDSEDYNKSFLENALRHGVTGGVDITSMFPATRMVKTVEGAYQSLQGAKGTSYGKLTLGITEPTKLFRILGDVYDYFKFDIYKSGVEDLDQDIVLDIGKKINPALVKQFENDPNNGELLAKINEEVQTKYKELGINALQKWFETSPVGFLSDYVENPKNLFDFLSSLRGDFERANAIREVGMVETPQYNMLKKLFYNMGLGESFETKDFMQVLNQYSNNMVNWGLLDKKTGLGISKRYQEMITKPNFEFKRLPKYRDSDE